ncbi:MAG: RIP metalloprotease RseP [Candidatus Cloacimonetes bacterium]|jgi:regulator of sigma E protease|nr:RIP metalloprotease RseP [Candidatus Cloacimonadota bacterium]MBT4333255.1 RIP metalloprotease RseP [Candidatus Cloacimonadota bacterium]MBT4574965.1 RIP metalloprotease RseP [Candidatus Cloacimonadota bacterium]
MFNIIGAIIALGVLVTVHELGHFIAARIFNVEVEKFSIGFGPKLLSFKKGKTEYRISLIPLGGYLKMKGENPDEEVENSENSFKTKTWWQRAIIAFAGPFANLILALLIFILTFAIGRQFEDQLPIVGEVSANYSEFVQEKDTILQVNDKDVNGWTQIIQNMNIDGENTFLIQRNDQEILIPNDEIEPRIWVTEILPFVPAVIGEVAPGMAAYKAGLMEQDEILSVDGTDVKNWYEMRTAITTNENDAITLKIKRGDDIFEKSLEPEENILDNNRIIGITQYMPVKYIERYSLFESVKYGTLGTINFVYLNYAMLYKLITNPGAIKNNLGGPVMIYAMSAQTADKGIDSILSFIAAISLILMIMNLLPIPILDGGHIFFCFIEGIRKKPLSIKIQIVLQNMGLFVLMFLMVFAFWNDISRLFSRSSSIKANQEQIENGG